MCLLQRVRSAWNPLLGMVDEANTILTFRRHLDKHQDMQEMEEYGRSAGR